LAVAFLSEFLCEPAIFITNHPPIFNAFENFNVFKIIHAMVIINLPEFCVLWDSSPYRPCGCSAGGYGKS
jgi:hypothetical protein